MREQVIQIRKRVIEAPVSLVWSYIADIEQWPSWNPLCKAVRVLDPIGAGCRFEYSNGRHMIAAVITEFEEAARFSFTGRALGVSAWNCCRVYSLSPESTLAEINEEMRGWLPFLFSQKCNVKLGEGLESWMDGLAWACSANPAKLRV